MFHLKKLTLFLLVALFSTTALYPISATAQTSNPSNRSILMTGTGKIDAEKFREMSAPYSYSGIKPFGGRIISIQPCKTPPGMMLTIGGPRGGQFLLTDSSKIYNYSVFAPSIWILGNASRSVVVCKGKSGLNSAGFALSAASMAIGAYSQFYTASFSLAPIGLGDSVLNLSTIGKALGITNVGLGGLSGFANSFGFGKKLDTLGSPYIIQIVGTGLTP